MMITATTTASTTPASTAICADAWVSAGQAMEDALERLERRTRLLGYIRDMRDLLVPWGVSRSGDQPQAYRDRWSSLCRQLCEDGRPVLVLISCNPTPA